MDDLIAALSEAIVDYDDFKDVAWDILNDYTLANLKEEIQPPLGYSRAMLTFHDSATSQKVKKAGVNHMAHLKVDYLQLGLKSWQQVIKHKSVANKGLNVIESLKIAVLQQVVIVTRRNSHYVVRMDLHSHLVEFRNHGQLHLMVYKSNAEQAPGLRARLMGLYQPKNGFI